MDKTNWTMTRKACADVKGFFLEAEQDNTGSWDVFDRKNTPVSEIGSIAQFKFDGDGGFKWFKWSESAHFYLGDLLTEEDVREAVLSLYGR